MIGIGIILSGSPYSVYDVDAPHVDPDVFTYGVPILGICYGLQEIGQIHGATVQPSDHREYGNATIKIVKQPKGASAHMDKLFEGIEDDSVVSAIKARQRE